MKPYLETSFFEGSFDLAAGDGVVGVVLPFAPGAADLPGGGGGGMLAEAGPTSSYASTIAILKKLLV